MGAAGWKGAVVKTMFAVEQGDILLVEGVVTPVLVVSKNFFNRTEQVIACPIRKKARPDPLHIEVCADDFRGIVLCEQMKLLDLHARGYKKISSLPAAAIMDVIDAVQGIFDYYPYGNF